MKIGWVVAGALTIGLRALLLDLGPERYWPSAVKHNTHGPDIRTFEAGDHLPLVDALPELMTPASAALGVPYLG